MGNIFFLSDKNCSKFGRISQ